MLCRVLTWLRLQGLVCVSMNVGKIRCLAAMNTVCCWQIGQSAALLFGGLLRSPFKCYRHLQLQHSAILD